MKKTDNMQLTEEETGMGRKRMSGRERTGVSEKEQSRRRKRGLTERKRKHKLTVQRKVK